MADEKKEAKVKKPSALKRDNQGERRRLQNRTYQSTVNTAMKALKQSVSQKDTASVKKNLSAVFSLMDKGVKKGLYSRNKAGRVKSRLTKQISA